MKLKAVVEGSRAGAAVDIGVRLDNGELHFDVPTVNRANRVEFSMSRRQLDEALRTLDSAGPTTLTLPPRKKGDSDGE